jgi:hypothetical protein
VQTSAAPGASVSQVGLEYHEGTGVLAGKVFAKAEKPITFGIDFDGTWNADSPAFGALVTMLMACGHKCVVVTGRKDEGRMGDEVRAELARVPVWPHERPAIVFAGSKWKRAAALEAGHNVQIWIDDNPEYIGPKTLLQLTPRVMNGGGGPDEANVIETFLYALMVRVPPAEIATMLEFVNECGAVENPEPFCAAAAKDLAFRLMRLAGITEKGA